MNLETRILLAYGFLVALLVISAAAAAVGFRDLGASIGDILDENFKSVRAAAGMLESLERQDAAVVRLLMQEQTSTADLEQSDRDFLAALAEARENITIAEETRIVDRIGTSFEAYQVARDGVLREPPETPFRAYQVAAAPSFEEVKRGILELLDINHQAMIEADRAASRSAIARAAMHGLLVALALLALAPIAQGMRTHVLGRIRELSEVAGAIADGDRSRRVTVSRNDELGLVGLQLNAMLDRAQRTEAESEGRFQYERRLLQALVAALPGQRALVARDGRIVADALPPARRRALGAALSKVRHRLQGDDNVLEFEVDGKPARLTRLNSDGGSSPAWMAVLDGPAEPPADGQAGSDD